MNQRDEWNVQGFYAPQPPMTLVREVPYGPHGMYGADPEVQYVVVQEDYQPTTPAEAANYQQLMAIAGPLLGNAGKSAAKLKSDISYLKTLRQKFPMFKDLINKVIAKKRGQMEVATQEYGQETLRDKGYTYLTYAGVALFAAATISIITWTIRRK